MSIESIAELGFPWETVDPFLFCVHHVDDYPAGNGRLGLDRQRLAGRDIGSDFSAKGGWSMYHGDMVPGFPRHPHRGFETVTVARRGFIDHSDSLGATARFGHGDVQWMTAGAGIVHSEMFPLVDESGGNPTELFQIWLNLPKANKMVEPHFSMLWSETIPSRTFEGTRVTTIAGALDDLSPPASPPKSWAADPSADLAIWTVVMEPGARWTLPAARARSKRTLYFFAGDEMKIAGESTASGVAVGVRADASVDLENGATRSELLVLGGRPIGEPVAAHGPFVMNSRDEILEAFTDFQQTGFGGWPWSDTAPVHDKAAGRFAIHADGRRDEPTT